MADCEWCGAEENLTDIGNLILCPVCIRTKNQEDAFDSYIEEHGTNANIVSFFETQGHRVCEPILLVDFLSSLRLV